MLLWMGMGGGVVVAEFKIGAPLNIVLARQLWRHDMVFDALVLDTSQCYVLIG